MKYLLKTLLIVLALSLATESFSREVISLNEGWRFFFKNDNSSDNARHVTLPHSWNVNAQAEDGIDEKTGNYLNKMFVPEEWRSKRFFLKCYGVQSLVDVYVNGFFVGNHLGAGSAFTFEITDKLRFGDENLLLLSVSNVYRSDVLPTSTDMNFYGGIYRNVELIVTDSTAISPLYLGSDGVLVHSEEVDANRAAGEVEVHLLTKGENSCFLNLSIIDPDGGVVFARRQKVRLDGRQVMIPYAFDCPKLWSLESPNLYTVRVTMELDGQPITDCVEVRTGFRSVAITPDGGFLLNGKRVNVRGVTLYHDNVISCATPTMRDMEEDLALMADLGVNALRSAVLPHAQMLYDRCDETGVLAWVDAPLHRTFLSDMGYIPTPEFEANGLRQLREIVAQNINHPSVVMWGIFSRLWLRGDDPVAFIRKMNDTAHNLDPSRPTVACSDQNGGLNFITDAIVWQQNVGWDKGSTDDVEVWCKQLRKNWSHLSSGVAYGGAGMIGHRNNLNHQGETATQQSMWFPEERQTRFHEDYARHIEGDSLMWGVWINNMFDYGSARRPYGINCEGLVSIDRREKKDAYYLYRALWNKQKPTLHLTEKRYAMRDLEPQTFRIYSSEGMPQLVVGADTVAVTDLGACQYRSEPMPLKAGLVEVKVSCGELRDSVTLLVGSLSRPKKPTVLLRKE